MKQYALLIVMTFLGSVASFWWTPYAGVALYYFYAVLRPQFLWKWQLIGIPIDFPWSFCVAAAAIFSYIAWSAGFISFGRREASLMRYRPQFNIAHKCMMLFAFWIMMSYLRSNDQEQSEQWFGEYLKIFGMYYLASRVVRTPSQVWGLYMFVLGAIGYIAYEANMIYIQTQRLVLYSAGFAGLDNNGAGLMLAMGVPLCFFAWEFTRHRIRWLFLMLIPVIVHAVLGTYSRGAMASMIAALPFYFLYSRKRKFLFVLTVIGLFSLPFLAGKEIQERFLSIQDREVDESYNSRQLSWGIAKEIAWDYPVFGAGIRCSNKEMKQRGADMEGRTIHSLYLQLAADSGWFALGIYLLLVLTSYYCVWRARIRLWRRTDDESRRACAMLGGIECATVTFLVGAAALSLEVFEVSYLMLLLSAQIWALLNATDTLAKEQHAGSWGTHNHPSIVDTRMPTGRPVMWPRAGAAPRPRNQSAPPPAGMPRPAPTPPRNPPGYPAQ